jgi:hypothetical protein
MDGNSPRQTISNNCISLILFLQLFNPLFTVYEPPGLKSASSNPGWKILHVPLRVRGHLNGRLPKSQKSAGTYGFITMKVCVHQSPAQMRRQAKVLSGFTYLTTNEGWSMLNPTKQKTVNGGMVLSQPNLRIQWTNLVPVSQADPFLQCLVTPKCNWSLCTPVTGWKSWSLTQGSPLSCKPPRKCFGTCQRMRFRQKRLGKSK